MQLQLEETLKELSEKHLLIFVIDELERLDEIPLVYIMKTLETLANHSFTFFVFILEDEFLRNSKDAEFFKPRISRHSYFSQRIFLRKPLFDEMQEHIDNIIENSSALRSSEDYHTFRNYVCYETKTDFSQLYAVLSDRIFYSGEQEAHAFLDIKLNRDELIKANLQKAIVQIYLRKAYTHPSDWTKNDLLLERMYELSDKLLIGARSGSTIRIENKPSSSRIILQDRNLMDSDVLEVDDSVQADAIEDQLYYLEKLQFLKRKGNSYEITGRLDQKVPEHPIIVTQEEKDFLKKYKELREVLFAYADIYCQSINYDELLYDENQIIAKFDHMGISSSSPYSASNIRIVSEVISIYHNIEDRKLDHTRTPIFIGREKLEDKTRLTINARAEYLDKFILFIQHILKKIRSDAIEVIQWSKIYEEQGISMPASLEDLDTLTNVLLGIHIRQFKIIIAQNLPKELRRLIENGRTPSNEFLILFTTRTEGNFMDPVTESFSNTVTSLLDDLDALASSDTKRVSRTLELNIPVNKKLLYRLLHGIILLCVRNLGISDYQIFEPAKEEVINSSSSLSDSEEVVAATDPTRVAGEKSPSKGT